MQLENSSSHEDVQPNKPEDTPEQKLVREIKNIGKFGTDPTEVTSFIQKNIGQLVGGVEIRKDLYGDYNLFALNLGQAVGLLKQGSSYDGTPRNIVENVLNNLYGPPAIISAFREVATRYIDNTLKADRK